MVRAKYRTFTPRFWAAVLDTLVLMPVVMLVNWFHAVVDTALLSIPIHFMASMAFVSYSILLHGYYGQTLGKMATGVKVLTLEESDIDLRTAILRDSPVLVTAILSFALDVPRIVAGYSPYEPGPPTTGFIILNAVIAAWWLLEFGTMLLNNKRRAIHDFIAGTVVIRTALKDERDLSPRKRESGWEQMGRIVFIFFALLFVFFLIIVLIALS